ncbi:N-acetylmuramoyl-L-alanine amidase [Candidatus Saccharibacteria bacterium]|nr:MAG: N-acetylmuramoyl-L-alanine amidase [Candidatus Saccharibacteria bacterium]
MSFEHSRTVTVALSAALFISSCSWNNVDSYQQPNPGGGVSAGQKPSPQQYRADSGRPWILLDPGHSGNYRQKDELTGLPSPTPPKIDAITGLPDIQYRPDTPEIDDVFDVATLLRSMLEANGYKVCMTKKTANDYVSHRERANLANGTDPKQECGSNGAALAVSIHTDPTAPKSRATMSPQFVGGSRGGVDGYLCKNKNQCSATYPRVTFEDATLAMQSLTATQIIAEERTKAEGRLVVVENLNFNGRLPLPPGNLSLVQLYSNKPWTYAEYGANVNGSTRVPLTATEKQNYAAGLANGIFRTVRISAGH